MATDIKALYCSREHKPLQWLPSHGDHTVKQVAIYRHLPPRGYFSVAFIRHWFTDPEEEKKRINSTQMKYHYIRIKEPYTAVVFAVSEQAVRYTDPSRGSTSQTTCRH